MITNIGIVFNNIFLNESNFSSPYISYIDGSLPTNLSIKVQNISDNSEGLYTLGDAFIRLDKQLMPAYLQWLESLDDSNITHLEKLNANYLVEALKEGSYKFKALN